jgi:hypothetical protein
LNYKTWTSSDVFYDGLFIRLILLSISLLRNTALRIVIPLPHSQNLKIKICRGRNGYL